MCTLFQRDFNKHLTVNEMIHVQCRETALKEIVQDLLIGGKLLLVFLILFFLVLSLLTVNTTVLF